MTAALKLTNGITLEMLKDPLTKKNIATKSYKTRDRIAAIKEQLKIYYESIDTLYAFAEGRETLKGKGYSDRAERYRRTQADVQRLTWTISNLQLQIRLLKREIDMLLEYGA